jgi:HlyD family secretion protein
MASAALSGSFQSLLRFRDHTEAGRSAIAAPEDVIRPIEARRTEQVQLRGPLHSRQGSTSSYDAMSWSVGSLGMPRPLVVIVVVASVLVGAGAWWTRQRDESTLQFQTSAARRGDIVVTVNSTGTVEPEEVIDVGAQVAGMVTSFGKDKSGKSIDYSSIVEEGTILAQIDDSVYAADVELAEAQVTQAVAGEKRAAADLDQLTAKVAQAEADWERAQKLGPSEALAPAAFDSYKAAYAVAKANVALGDAAIDQARASTVQAKATLNKARRNLNFCVIRAPVRGVIIDRRVNIGQTVVSSLNAPSLFLIAKDLSRIQVWVAVNEADVGRIVPGTPASFTCDAFPNQTFEGTVGKVRLNATMTQNVVMYTVEVNAENRDDLLLPYLTANVRFTVRKESNVLLAPNAALRWAPSSLSELVPDLRSAYVVDAGQADKAAKSGGHDEHGTVWIREGDFARPVEVVVGASDGTNSVITGGGLKEGDEVITGEELTSSPAGTASPFVPQLRRR